MFTYEHLIAFCSTLEEGSYSQAARKLNKDRTTIREQVKLLEDSYLTQLFTINGKKAIPTPFAESIYKQSKLIVKNSERLHLRMLNAYSKDLTSIDFYHDILIPIDLVIKIEAFFLEHFPDIIVNWLHRNRDEILDAVTNGHNQIAIMQHRTENLAEKPLNAVKLGDGDIAAYARPTSPIFKNNAITIEDLQIETQYISENHVKTMPEWFIVSPNFRTISNNDMLLELVRKNGWALLSQNLAQPEVIRNLLRQIPFKELTSTTKFGLSFFYPMSFESTPIFNGLLKEIKHYSKQYL